MAPWIASALVALIAGTALAAASGTPDLVETGVILRQNGFNLHITDAVRNRGSATASASQTGYYLARRRIGRRLATALRPGAVSRGVKTLTVPRSVPAGSWRLRVCADSLARVRESDEHNNCRTAANPVVVEDVRPPRFTGLERATTCVPGPIGGQTRYTPYSLVWTAATDDVTRSSAIVYEIYEARTSGAEDFATPTYEAPPGATSFSTPPLPDDVAHYFVVRARDRAGNRDRNKVERLGENLCL
jgi:hypothetical protein